ncbi:hypothetical protein MHBO_001677, partial [Bonamia ostreae]
ITPVNSFGEKNEPQSVDVSGIISLIFVKISNEEEFEYCSPTDPFFAITLIYSEEIVKLRVAECLLEAQILKIKEVSSSNTFRRIKVDILKNHKNECIRFPIKTFMPI